MVNVATADHLESLNCVGNRNRRSSDASEFLGSVRVLGQELLDAAGPRHSDLVLFAQLIHTENSDDVLKLLVALQNLFDLSSGVVMLLAYVCLLYTSDAADE